MEDEETEREEISMRSSEIRFPEDEAVHDHIVEWWYFNGHLVDNDGCNYSFMDCLFRVDVKKVKIPFISRIPLKISYFTHSILTEHKTKKCVRRIAPFSIISDDSFSKPTLCANYINPQLKYGYTNCVIEKISGVGYYIKNEDIELFMESSKKPLLVGATGYLDLCSKKTYYYSLTNLKTEGRIKIKDKWINVNGKSWMDHQWANTCYSKDKWDWFSLQLHDGTDIICFLYDDGINKTYCSDISYPDGRQEHFDDIELIPMNRRWTSPESKATYPLDWTIRIPSRNIELILEAQVEEQEMIFGSINYWEGPLNVTGEINTSKITGVGFMELVGYPSRNNNVNHIKEEIGTILNRYVFMAKKKTATLIGAFKKTDF